MGKSNRIQRVNVRFTLAGYIDAVSRWPYSCRSCRRMELAQTYSCICDETYRCSPFNVGTTKQRNELPMFDLLRALCAFLFKIKRSRLKTLLVSSEWTLHKHIAASVVRLIGAHPSM